MFAAARILAALAALAGPAAAANPPDTSKMNILFINIEDCNAGVLGCYLELKKGPVRTALYDLEQDPWETVNLANDPASAEARQELAELLKQGWKAALPRP